MKRVFAFLFLSISYLMYSCEKDESAIPNTSMVSIAANSPKRIISVTFKSTDNPDFEYDISGILNGDSVQCLFPPNTDMSNLVPDISFVGESISPANKVVQNFNQPVIYTITAEDGTTKAYTIACNTADSATMLVGKWRLIKDSVTNNGSFVIRDGGYPLPGVYIGKAGDYWEFKRDGFADVYYYGGTMSFKGHKYQLLPNARLYINELSASYDDAYILTLTFNTATFFWTATNVNGGRYSRTLYLKK